MKILTIASGQKSIFLKRYRLKQYTKKAHDIRKNIIERSGKEIVNKSIKDLIKKYSKEMFGSTSFWPWLALYTEIRGEFIRGWVPNDYFQVTLLDKWNPVRFSELSDMKTFYHSYFDDFTIRPIAVRVSGIYYDHRWQIIERDILIDILRSSEDEIVVKKDSGFAGRGIQFFHTQNIKIKDLETNKENLVIQPVVRQHNILSNLHETSLNTIRISTFLDDDGSVSHKFILIRFGRGGNRVDNANAGGRFIFLDNDGKPISGVIDGMGYNVNHEDPVLSDSLKHVKIPSVKVAVDQCIKYHKKFPYVRYIAWDVCIDTDLIVQMIEWNAVRPGMWHAEPYVGPIWNLDSILP